MYFDVNVAGVLTTFTKGPWQLTAEFRFWLETSKVQFPGDIVSVKPSPAIT